MGIKQVEIEFWMPIHGYEGLYEVSDHGRVRSLNYRRKGTPRVLKLKSDKDGYLRITLKNKGFGIHRLVYETFVQKIPSNMEIDHIDGDKTNNRLDNLRCVSHLENMRNPNTLIILNGFECKHDSKKRGRKPGNGKEIVQIDVNDSSKVIKRWSSIRSVERILGIPNSHICNCCTGQRKTAGGYKWCYFMPPAVIYNQQGLGS